MKSQNISSELLGLLVYSISTLCVAGISILAKVATHQGLTVMLIALARGIIVLIFSVPSLMKAGCNPLGNNHVWLVVRGILGWLSGVLLYATVQWLPLAEATVLSFLAPLWAAIGCSIFLREPPPRVVWVCLPICLGAVFVVARPPAVFGHSTEPLPLIGVMLGCLQGVVSASVRLVVRHLRHTDKPPVIIFYQGLAATILSPLAMLFFPSQRSLPVHPSEWMLLLCIGLVGFGNQVTLTLGLRLAQASTCTLLAYLQLVWALLAGWFIFHEALEPKKLVGVAVIMLCTLSMAWQQQRTAKPNGLPTTVGGQGQQGETAGGETEGLLTRHHGSVSNMDTARSEVLVRPQEPVPQGESGWPGRLKGQVQQALGMVGIGVYRLAEQARADSASVEVQPLLSRKDGAQP